MRLTIRPSTAPNREIDLTAALTAVVAHELWKHGGGNEVLNWLEAERFVQALAAGQRVPTLRRGRTPGRPAQRPPAKPAARFSTDPDRHTGPLPILGGR